MKILHIYKSYYPETLGGCEAVIDTLATATQKMGYENYLLTSSRNPNPNYEQLNQVQVIRQQASFEVASCPMSWQMYKEFRQHVNSADILHYHFPWPFADLMHVWHGIKKPTLVTYHSDIVNKGSLGHIYAPLMRIFLKRVNCIVPTSPNLLASSASLQAFRNKCQVIPLGIDAQEYSTPAPALLQKWQQQLPERFILFVGVLRAYKGLNYLIDAVKNTEVPIVIAGTGPLADSLKQQARDASNIHFVGRVSDEDKCALLSLSCGVVLPSHLRSEAFGISLLEGMVYAKPLISTELGTGTSYVNENNVTGFVVPPADVNALQIALVKIVQDQTTAEKMGQNARARYEQNFTAEMMVNKYVNIYQAIVSRN